MIFGLDHQSEKWLRSQPESQYVFAGWQFVGLVYGGMHVADVERSCRSIFFRFLNYSRLIAWQTTLCARQYQIEGLGDPELILCMNTALSIAVFRFQRQGQRRIQRRAGSQHWMVDVDRGDLFEIDRAGFSGRMGLGAKKHIVRDTANLELAGTMSTSRVSAESFTPRIVIFPSFENAD